MMIRSVKIGMALMLLLAIGIGIYYREQFDVQLLEQWLSQAGWWAPVVFILIYSIATVLFLPGSILTLTGGVIFGPVLGSLFNITGATIGAALAFLIARYLAADWVSERAGGRSKQLINGVEAEGWRFVAFVRLVPLFPFNLLNYALGLTKIRFIEYLLASCLFMLPGAIAYTYIGYAGREAVTGGDDLINTILIAIALLAVVMFLPRFIVTVRRGPSIDINELKRRLEHQETLLLDVRTDKDFHEAGHIEQAMNIPVEQLEQQLSKLDDHLDKSISIICTTDRRSAKAANLLLKHGYKDVHVVQGGMTDWNKQSK
jgi:uncharacterized membrane protein YdjX (TVP38/TMEM64 family)/rhodanese-related sulfurtransferase